MVLSLMGSVWCVSVTLLLAHQSGQALASRTAIGLLLDNAVRASVVGKAQAPASLGTALQEGAS